MSALILFIFSIIINITYNGIISLSVIFVLYLIYLILRKANLKEFLKKIRYLFVIFFIISISHYLYNHQGNYIEISFIKIYPNALISAITFFIKLNNFSIITYSFFHFKNKSEIVIIISDGFKFLQFFKIDSKEIAYIFLLTIEFFEVISKNFKITFKTNNKKINIIDRLINDVKKSLVESEEIFKKFITIKNLYVFDKIRCSELLMFLFLLKIFII